MPDFAQILAGSNTPHSPLLCPSGLHSAKGLHDFVPALAKMLVGSAEPFCLLLMTRVEPKALSTFQKILSPLQDVALVHYKCIIIKEYESVTKSWVLIYPFSKKNGKLYIPRHEAVHFGRVYSDSSQFSWLLCTDFMDSENNCPSGMIWS